MTLFAGWTADTYTVTLDPQGGSVSPETITVTYDSSYGTLPTPTRTGYTFTGWYTAPGGGALVEDSTLVSTAGDHTLYATWVITPYTVTFDSRGGTPAPSAVTLDYDSLISEPPVPMRTGYTFNGWYSDTACTVPWNFSTDTLGAGDMTLYAGWTANTYTISFDSNGGSAVAPMTAAYGSLITPPAAPVLAGMVFTGWYKDAALTEQWNFSSDTVGAGDITLYASWRIGTCKVTYDYNLSATISTTTEEIVTIGENATPPATPVRAGYIFTGWYTDKDLTNKVTFPYAPTGDITLYAGWMKNTGTPALPIPEDKEDEDQGREEEPAPVKKETITITIPYDIGTKNPAYLVAVYTDENGVDHTIPNGHYDPVTGTYICVIGKDLADVKIRIEYRPVNLPNVDTGHWAYDAINTLAARGVIRNTDIVPDVYVTRAELVEILALSTGIDFTGYTAPTSYSDVEANSDAAAYINWATETGVVTGYEDGTFRPDDNISRQEVCAMITRYAEVYGIVDGAGNPVRFADENAIGTWAKSYVDTLTSNGIVKGVTINSQQYFLPRYNMTNAEIATIVARILDI
jgi:uncharacterized repeat protein (TIGR02543 family)